MDSSSFSLNNVAAAINIFTLLCTLFFLAYRNFRSQKETKTTEENKTVRSSSLVPSSLPRNWKHHVFPSFHGADVRRSLLSHILKEFKIKAIDLFIDNNIERSKSIGPELIEAIRGSRMAIVLLSKNYASSTWCLDELVEIIRCREEFDQTVMVLFYEVDPTDVKKQTGEFGKVFRNTCKGKTKDNIARWKQVLAEVAKIAGYHSRNWDTEAEMIETIATDVSNKLNVSTPSNDFKDLVGIDFHMFQLEPMLRFDLEEVRIIGIWGPSGIGKTTIARVLYKRYTKDFQLCAFMENIKTRYPTPACSDDYNVKLHLQEQFMSQIINQEGFKIPHLGIVKDRLKDKKVFVVLDDVDRLVQLEAMAKETCWFGPWSRIIITTQDRKLLQASGINHTYKVEFPSSDEALRMFCKYAFDQETPEDGFMELVEEVISLAGELPLGLRVMGSYFRGMSKQMWIKALPRLMTRLDGEIESILKFGYDVLCDEDKNVFLHIACFFNNERVDIVEGCLAKSFPGVTQGLQILAEKSLIDINLDMDMIEMHNLLVQLGREIVRKQSHKPWKRQFLDDARDIGDDKADCSSVIGIDLMSSYDNEEDIASVSERAFERLSNLQFVRIINDNGTNPQNLNFISRELRYLSWKNFQMPRFPSSFHPNFLVKLDMPFSKLEKLWEGIQPLSNLKWMNLSYSKSLKELPDLSTATELCELHLSFCSSLMGIPISIGSAISLKKLDLRNCSSLVELPTSIGNVISLKYLDLRNCSSLVELPTSIGNVISLKNLNLSYCSSLVELPTSIGNVINLKNLDLSYCSSLVELPSSVGNLSNLGYLDLSHCISLVALSSSIGNAINLQRLNMSHCSSLVEIPSSIGNAINLQELNLSGCTRLVELPATMKNLSELWKLNLKGCSKLEVCLTNINSKSLGELNLSYCSLLNFYHETPRSIEKLKLNESAVTEVPPVMKLLPRLFILDLSYCGMRELDPCIGRISSLCHLVLRGMQNLVSLPSLSSFLRYLDAEDCESLERLDCSFGNVYTLRLNFANCFKLNQEARDLIIHTRTNDYAVLPGGEVPACFTYRASGSSLTVKLDQKPLGTSTIFKSCIIFGNKDGYVFGEGQKVEVHCSITSKQNALTASRSSSKFLHRVLPEHLYTFKVEAVEVTSLELLFEFRLCNSSKAFEIKECGIFQVLEVPSY